MFYVSTKHFFRSHTRRLQQFLFYYLSSMTNNARSIMIIGLGDSFSIYRYTHFVPFHWKLSLLHCVSGASIDWTGISTTDQPEVAVTRAARPILQSLCSDRYVTSCPLPPFKSTSSFLFSICPCWLLIQSSCIDVDSAKTLSFSLSKACSSTASQWDDND